MIDEHFTPTGGLDLEEYVRRGDVGSAHHLARYLWLVDVLQGGGGRVLDLGCGSGYGSYLVARDAPSSSVLGIDHDPSGIAFARKSFSLPNLSYAVADAVVWNIPELSGEFDTAVSFDSIEHIPHRELFLERVVEHLSPSGRLFLSTPCGTTENELSPVWQAHRMEYGAASLFDFLSRYFRRLVRPEDEGFPGKGIFDRMREQGIDYLLRCNPVICEEPVRVNNPYR